jgi:defect-in-organelle-trafficking protein DotC
MKFNKIIFSLFVSSFLTSGILAEQVAPRQEKNITENSVKDIKDTLDSEYLYQYYKENASEGRTKIDYSYMIDKPLNMDEIRDLKHPYFNKHLSNLNKDDIDSVAQEYTKEKFKSLRVNSVFDEALKYGIQSSLYKVLFDFERKIESVSHYYDTNFNFNLLMMYNGRVKPPVVTEANQLLEKESNVQLREIDRAFTFLKQAEVVITPPSFRDYLTFEPLIPEQPNPLLLPLPEKPEEYYAWQKGVSEGWIQGTKQAYLIINEGLMELVRDYLGMQRYMAMLNENIVTLPVITESELGINSNGNILNVGESTFKISKMPEFNSNGSSWKAIPRVSDIFKDFYLTEEDKLLLESIKEEVETDYY